MNEDEYGDLFVDDDAPPQAYELPAGPPKPAETPPKTPLDPWLQRELAAGEQLHLPNVMAFIERTAAGQLVVQTQCRDCHKPVTLGCKGGDEQELWPERMSMLFADLIVCSDCEAKEDARREAYRQAQADERAERKAAAKARKAAVANDAPIDVDDVPTGPVSDTGEQMDF